MIYFYTNKFLRYKVGEKILKYNRDYQNVVYI